jgi:hypothetical protein
MKTKIFPKITPGGADGSAFDGRLAPKIEAAKRWLGDRYLLAQPINSKRRELKKLQLTEPNFKATIG